MLTEVPLCRGSSLRNYVDVLRKLGAPVDAGLRRAKLPVLFEERLDGWLPYRNVRSFLADMVRREGLKDLAERAAQQRSFRSTADRRLSAPVFAAPTLFNALYVLTRAISFKGEAFFDEATECPIATYRANGNRIDFVAELTANWARLRRTPTTGRKVALILANYPNKDGRLANGVGLDTPAATANTLKLLSENGDNIRNVPSNSAALMAQITAGPTNWLTDRAEKGGGECHVAWPGDDGAL